MICQYQLGATNQIQASGGSAVDNTGERETLDVIDSWHVCLLN